MHNLTLSNRKLDFIFNTTLICQWNCDFCCVDAIQVMKNGSDLVMLSQSLKKEERFKIDQTKNIFEQAYQIRLDRGQELDLEKKKKIIDNIIDYNSRIDISGGDALLIRDNFDFLIYASSSLGKDNVSLTVTGSGSAKYEASEVTPYIDEYNFTFDSASLNDVIDRPNGYAISNLKKATKFHKNGCKTRAELPLTTNIIDENHLIRLYKELHLAEIDKLLVMRLFPVGRGILSKANLPSNDQYLKAIEILYREEEKYKYPKVKLQCALKHLINKKHEENPCDLFRSSFGIMPNGNLILSPWAYDNKGDVLSEDWVLGNISQISMHTIFANSSNNENWKRIDENFGQCKIFSFANSKKINFYDRLFDKSDPLYSND